MTAEQLSAAMAEAGVPFNTSVLANLETGRRRYVTVAEWLALARVLDVRPRQLLILGRDEQHRALTAADRDEHADVIDTALSALREAVDRGLPLYGLFDYLELNCQSNTTVVYGPDYEQQEQQARDSARTRKRRS